MHNQEFAFVFPGQGSQSVGMLADITAQYPEVKQTFAQAADILGYDLWKLVAAGPANELDKTEYTQPALLVASYAIWQIVQTRIMFEPAYLAGHSLGEYTALVAAKALLFQDAVNLVAARGKYMQEAVVPGAGAMAAIIGLDESQINAVVTEASLPEEVLAIANYNSIGQIVIAGHKTAVERAVPIAKDLGAKLAVILPVSVPSHCQLMVEAAEKLSKLLNAVSFAAPQIPVINNVDVAFYSSADAIREGLKCQLFMPVRWVATIQKLIELGVKDIVECGPGKVLLGLAKRIDKKLQLQSLADLSSLNYFLQQSEQKKTG